MFEIIDKDLSSTKVRYDISEAPMSHVTVYKSNQAEIIRKLVINAETADSLDLTIRGFSEILKDSLRIDCKGECIVNNFEVREVIENNSDLSNLEKIKKIEAEIFLLKEIEKTLQKETEQNYSIECYYKQFTSQYAKKDDIKIHDLASVLEFSNEKLNLINQKTLQISIEEKKIREKVEELEKKIEYLKNVDATRTRILFIDLQILEAVKIDLILRYVVENVSWEVSYDLHCDTNKKEVELAYYGKVMQNTGEIWENVPITLTTGSLSLEFKKLIPEPKIFEFEDIQDENDEFFEGRLNNSYQNSYGKYDSYGKSKYTASTNTLKLSQKVPVKNQIKNLIKDSLEYLIKTPQTVKSGNTPKRVKLIDLNFKAEIAYIAVPSVEAKAQINVKILNDSDDYLLASNEVLVYSDGKYITKTEIKQLSPHENINVSLGFDKNIEILRNPTHKTPEILTVDNGMKSTKYSTSTVISNFKEVPIVLNLIDTIPTSSDTQMIIEINEPDNDLIEKAKNQSSFTSSVIEIEQTNEIVENKVVKIARNDLNEIVWVIEIPKKNEVKVEYVYTIKWFE
mmetsp:Transcript_1133/g.1743  ORF Transcript_1133/g.1743 Transcript_1133/m.1743 type:complete len:568 (+) Transcript_1133:58-1761(+)